MSESRSARTSTAHHVPRHESEYLNEQRTAAQGAIRESLRQFGRTSVRLKDAIGRHPFALAGVAAGATGALALWLHLRSVKKHHAPEPQADMKRDGLWHKILKLPAEIAVSAILRRLAAPFQESLQVETSDPAGGN